MDERRNSTYNIRVRAVRAVLQGRSISDVADAYDTNRSTISRWVARFEEEGEEGLMRWPTSNRPRMLAQLTEDELRIDGKKSRRSIRRTIFFQRADSETLQSNARGKRRVEAHGLGSREAFAAELLSIAPTEDHVGPFHHQLEMPRPGKKRCRQTACDRIAAGHHKKGAKRPAKSGEA